MRLHVGARSWLIHQTIKSLEARLDPDRFIRIHRSKMVRRDGIAGLRHHGDGAWSVDLGDGGVHRIGRSEEHTSELQSLMRISYAVFCLNNTILFNTINYLLQLHLL